MRRRAAGGVEGDARLTISLLLLLEEAAADAEGCL